MAIELALALAGTDVKEPPSVVNGRPCASEGVKISGVKKESEWIEDGLIKPGEVYSPLDRGVSTVIALLFPILTDNLAS